MKTKLRFRITFTGLAILFCLSFNSFSQNHWYEQWERYENNPILTGPVEWTNHIFSPLVVHDADGYKMWFTGWIDDRSIGYAESDDGFDWDVHPNPVLPLGDPTDWDYQKFTIGSVLLIDDTLRMWYMGTIDWGFAHIGYAWSLDGITWHKNEDPVLNNSHGCSVYFDGEEYYMYFTKLHDDIYYASSEDGVNWTVENDGDPVIERGPDGSWNDQWVIPDGLVMLNDTLRMFFTGGDGTGQARFFRTGYAWSLEYVNWNVHDNYVFDVIPNDDYESKQVGSGTILFEEDALKMWYLGYGELNYFAACYAEIDFPIVCLEGGYTITNQAFIDNFHDNFPFCKEIAGDLTITSNDIANLDGLSKIELIDGKLDIMANPLLENVSGFENLEAINGDFFVTMNDNLEDFSGMEKLVTLGGGLYITDNNSLDSLNGLDNIDPESIELLSIAQNDMLTHCAILSVCDYRWLPEANTTIQDNATGCDNEEELNLSCEGVSVKELNTSSHFTIQPNPFRQLVTLEYELKKSGFTQLIIYNHQGKQVETVVSEVQPQGLRKVNWNAESLPAGIYYCVLITSKGSQTAKLVKLK